MIMDIFSLSDNDMAHGNYPYLIDTLTALP